MFHTLVCHSGLLEISRSGTFWFKLSKKLEGHHIGICQILLSGLLHCFLVCVSFSMICLATVFCQEFQSVGTLTCTAWKGGDSLEKGADQPIQYLKLEWHRPLTSSVCSLLLWLLNQSDLTQIWFEHAVGFLGKKGFGYICTYLINENRPGPVTVYIKVAFIVMFTVTTHSAWNLFRPCFVQIKEHWIFVYCIYSICYLYENDKIRQIVHVTEHNK